MSRGYASTKLSPNFPRKEKPDWKTVRVPPPAEMGDQDIDHPGVVTDHEDSRGRCVRHYRPRPGSGNPQLCVDENGRVTPRGLGSGRKSANDSLLL
jgi:hypothetical protein